MESFTWTGTVEPWKAEQQRLREQVVVRPLKRLPTHVAGVDCAFGDGGKTIRAAAVVYDRQTQTIVESATGQMPCTAPYIPGYLSFREVPAVLTVIRKLKTPFGAILCDGQGLAHPRRCGLASHVGVLLDVPTIGVAKSRFIGTHDTPGEAAGSQVPLMDGEEQIGVVLRTRDRTNPLYISVGHRVDLTTAVELVMTCRTKYRLPEPTRIADQLSKVKE